MEVSSVQGLPSDLKSPSRLRKSENSEVTGSVEHFFCVSSTLGGLDSAGILAKSLSFYPLPKKCRDSDVGHP